MNRFGSRKHRVAGWLALVALMALVAVLATTGEEPEANAIPFGGGVPVRVYFNPDPADSAVAVQLWVQLSEAASPAGAQRVYLQFPDDIQHPAGILPNPPAFLEIQMNQKEGYVNITPTAAGWIAVLATSNGGRAGGVLEIEEEE